MLIKLEKKKKKKKKKKNCPRTFLAPARALTLIIASTGAIVRDTHRSTLVGKMLIGGAGKTRVEDDRQPSDPWIRGRDRPSSTAGSTASPLPPPAVPSAHWSSSSVLTGSGGASGTT
jgi:hypothetical protein